MDSNYGDLDLESNVAPPNKWKKSIGRRRSLLMAVLTILACAMACLFWWEGGNVNKFCMRLYVTHLAIRGVLFGPSSRDIDRDEDKDRVRAHPMDMTFVASTERIEGVADLAPYVGVTHGNNSSARGHRLLLHQSSPTIDVLSIGSLTRAENLQVQQSTWALHRSIRSFWGFTEDQDYDPTCPEMGENEIAELVDTCHAFEGWRDSVRYFVKEGFSVCEGYTVMKGDIRRDSGWFCAQRRVGRAIGWLEHAYAKREMGLPDYLLLVDDDTYFDLDSFAQFAADVGLNKSRSQVVSGCMFQRSGYIPWNFPYGGFGTVYTFGAIERMFRPIFCSGPSGGRDSFTEKACGSLQKNRIGERALFREGMNVAKLFHDYSALRQLCFHSDWLQGYFAEFYLVEEQRQDSNKQAMGIWPSTCGNITYDCQIGSSTCHRQSPEAMEYFARSAYHKSPHSYNREPFLPAKIARRLDIEKVEPESERSDLKQQKTLWMYWKQGIEHLQSLADTDSKYASDAYCVDAWKKLNPTWDVRVLDEVSAAKLAPKFRRLTNDRSGRINPVKAANVLRLELLTLYGGVWSDTSNCPMQPLDDFLPQLIEPMGFFTPVYATVGSMDNQELRQFEDCHNIPPTGDPDHPSGFWTRSNDNWFLAVGKPHNIIMERWLQALFDRMIAIATAPMTPTIPYFIAQCTFTQVRINDLEFEDAWSKFVEALTPFKHYWAEAHGIGLCYGGTDCDSDLCSTSSTNAVEYAKKRCFFVKKPTHTFADFVQSPAYSEYVGSQFLSTLGDPGDTNNNDNNGQHTSSIRSGSTMTKITTDINSQEYDINHIDQYALKIQQSPLCPDQAIEMLQQLTSNEKERTDKELQVITMIASTIGDIEGEPWNDFDYSLSPDLNCGANKCFWGSSSCKDQGYLLTRSHWLEAERFGQGIGYRQEQELLQFGTPPLSLEAPQPVSVPTHMNAVLKAYGHYHPDFDGVSFPMYIQKVRRIPSPHLLVAESENKDKKMKKKLPEFAAAIANTTAFKQRFRQETNRFQQIVQADHTFLLHDFQFELHTSGRWYYVDFDRTLSDYAPEKRSSTSEMLEVFQERMEKLLWWLTSANETDFKSQQWVNESFCISHYHCK